jgi:hypothetical protein
MTSPKATWSHQVKDLYNKGFNYIWEGVTRAALTYYCYSSSSVRHLKIFSHSKSNSTSVLLHVCDLAKLKSDEKNSKHFFQFG